jgi:hypothetical protein
MFIRKNSCELRSIEVLHNLHYGAAMEWLRPFVFQTQVSVPNPRATAELIPQKKY